MEWRELIGLMALAPALLVAIGLVHPLSVLWWHHTQTRYLVLRIYGPWAIAGLLTHWLL